MTSATHRLHNTGTLPLAFRLARGTVGEKDERLSAAPYVRFRRGVVAIAALSLTCLSVSAQETKREEPVEAPPSSPAVAGTPTFPLSLGTLPPGKGLTIRFRALVDDPFTGATPSVSNQGTVSGAGFGPVPTDDPDTVAIDDPTVTPVDLQPDLALTKSDGGGTVAPGGTVAYTLGYTNLSTFGAAGVVLTETVPVNTTFNAGASTAGWTCTPNGNPGSTCTLAVGTVAGGASGTATFAVTVVNPVAAGVTQIANTASVADARRPIPCPATTPRATRPRWTRPRTSTLTKSDGGASTTPGGTVTTRSPTRTRATRTPPASCSRRPSPRNTTFNAAGWTCAPNEQRRVQLHPRRGRAGGRRRLRLGPFAVTVATPGAGRRCADREHGVRRRRRAERSRPDAGEQHRDRHDAA